VSYAHESDRIDKLKLLPMQKVNMINTATTQAVHSGKPTMPFMGRQPIIERKISDPSSASPKGERYPIPSFFEYRMKPKDFDPL
jgi:hypothetical protein